MEKYKNIHTGKVVEVKKTETIKSFSDIIVIYILSDGTRWEKDLFLRHWKLEVTK